MEQTIASSKAGIINRETDNTASRPIFVGVLFFLAIVWQKIRTGYWHVRNRLSSDISAALDVDRISTQLAVVKRAEEDASRNMPPSDEEGPGGTQREIIAYFTNLRLRAQKHAAEDAERLNRTLEQIHRSDSLAQLRDIPAGCEHRILRHVADSESRLNNAFEREQNQKKHYDAFRKRNGLDRVAHYPGTGYYFYLAVPLLVITIIVALARMVGTFSGGDSGVSVAWIATVSAAAVIVPFILGDSLLRSINHVGKFRKVVGWIGAIAATAAIFGMASYTDFHIAAVLANPDASNREVLDAMLAAPLDVISSVANWKAFGLIGLTGLLAMLLAYRSDDPYPGYGAAQRACYRERNAREEVSARLRKRINTLIDESGAEVSTISKDFRDKVRMCTSLVEKSEQNPSALSDYDIELENTCNEVLDRYRVANAAARRTESPLSFAEHICFNPDSDLGSLQPSSGRHHVAELQAAIADLEKDADLARQKLRTLNLQMISSIAERHSVAAD